jgi:hypothetical protein
VSLSITVTCRSTSVISSVRFPANASLDTPKPLFYGRDVTKFSVSSETLAVIVSVKI